MIDMKRKRQFFTLFLIPLDYAMVWLSFVVAYAIRFRLDVADSIYLMPWPQYLEIISWLSVVWILAFGLVELYRFRGFSGGLQLVSRILLGVLIALGISTLLIFFTKTGELSRLVFLYTSGLAVTFVFIGRGLWTEFQHWLQVYGSGVEQVGIIGDNQLADIIAGKVKSRVPAQKLIFHSRKMEWDKLIHSQINRLVITADLNDATMLKVVRFCEDRQILLQYAPGLIGLYRSHIVTDYSTDHPLIELQPTPLTGWGRIVKRAFDIVVGLIILIIASPIMLLVAIAIKLDSRGPIIFAQKRVGELGRLFIFYKFRSMKTELSTGEGYGGKKAEETLAKLRAQNNEADGPMFKMANDPRVTRVGQFIRKTSLDEFPQLFNVLKGEMSLVGPRPALPNEVDEYSDAAKRRLLVKPGITGIWQVSGRNNIPFEEYVRMDTYYIENWSLWLDIKLILLTARAVFGKTGK